MATVALGKGERSALREVVLLRGLVEERVRLHGRWPESVPLGLSSQKSFCLIKTVFGVQAVIAQWLALEQLDRHSCALGRFAHS